MFSFAKASAAVLALASFVQATITIGAVNFKGNSTNTITWTSSDPNNDAESFSVELINEIFHSQFALGNNIATTQSSFTFQMPVVPPGPNYSLQFVNPGNINQIVAETGSFSIAENDVSSTTSATSGSSSASSVVASTTSAVRSVSSATGSLSQTATATGPITVSSVSSTAGVSSAASGSSSAPTASSSTFSSSGALELVPSGSFAALVAGVLALLF